jgi:pimeloyl-ACP methyl ester carboxylesterase
MAEFTEHHAEAGDVRLRYAQAGAGDPLIVLSAAAAPAPSPALSLLAGGRRVIAVGPPAAGGQPVTSRQAADAVADLATALGLETFDLLATAGDAVAACWLAVIAPDRVRALVLETPAAPDSDLAAALGQTRLPALVLAGTRDETSPPGQAVGYQRLLPNGFFSYVYGAGPDIARDRPGAFAGLVDDFLTRGGRYLVHDGAPLTSD